MFLPISPPALKIIFKFGITFLCLISLTRLGHSSFTWKRDKMLLQEPFADNYSLYLEVHMAY